MNKTAFKGISVSTNGSLPKVGELFPNLRLIKADLSVLETKDLKGKKVVFNFMPSVDTSVCAIQLNTFSDKLKDRIDVVNVFASYDLPFALSRFCGAKNIQNTVTTSDFRFRDLEKIGVVMINGPLVGLAARGTLVLDENQTVIYVELTNDIVDEPNYTEALKFI